MVRAQHLLALAWPSSPVLAFSPSLQRPSTPALCHQTSTAIAGGVGAATTYSWTEEQFELEVKVPVPPGTAAKDIKFKCSSDAIDLRLNCNNDDEKILLDGTRSMRGKICVDGTFWSLEGSHDNREIIVTIEKHFVPVSSSGGTETYDSLTDFDWGGVYPNDEKEVTHRKYDEAEELDVRECAKKLGVDIDNLDMSKVDKTMFGGGMSDQLSKMGLATEIVQQNDGSEYKVGADGSLSEDKVFSMLGKDVSMDELREAGIGGGSGGSNIPPLWEQASVPAEEIPGYQTMDDAGTADGILEDEIVESEIVSEDVRTVDVVGAEAEVPAEISPGSINEVKASAGDDKNSSDAGPPADPIDTLTVVRLKDILRAQGLKVSGNKQELRDRLREHVDGLLLEE